MARTMTVLVVATSLLLTSCATLFPKRNQPTIPVRCPAELLVDTEVQPLLPNGAGITRPQTDAQRAATAIYLAWLADATAWGRRGWERAETAKNWCKERENG